MKRVMPACLVVLDALGFQLQHLRETVGQGGLTRAVLRGQEYAHDKGIKVGYSLISQIKYKAGPKGKRKARSSNGREPDPVTRDPGMCGRFTLRTPTRVLVKQFQLGGVPDLEPRYNIAPTQDVAAVRISPASEKRELDPPKRPSQLPVMATSQ